nr:retrovirus-related Pol polyprotein from transposon TNT 1-94 [Tanacetum cinerariifolium]
MVKVKENALDVEIQNHFIRERPKSSRSNNKKAFIGGAWSDSGEDEEENAKDKTCLVAQASNKICLGIKLEPEEWIKDSGCSKHMTGYSQNSKAYIILNKHTMKVKESLNVTFDETHPPSKTSPLEDDDFVEEEAIEVSKTGPLGNSLEDNLLENNEIINIKESKSHPLENVIVPNPMDMTIIGNKWVFRNKLAENGVVSRNRARLVAQGYNQQEGINYDETYALVARLESIRILLAYACALDFKLFQTGVKSAFLNGFINEEVYMAQPPGLIDFAKPNMSIDLRKLFTDSNKLLKLGTID